MAGREGWTASVLDDLYYRLLVQSDYDAALDTLSSVFRAHAATIITVENGLPIIRANHGVDSQSLDAHASEFGQHDPMNRLQKENRTPAPLVMNQLTDLKGLYKSEYHQEVHAPSEIGDILAFRDAAPTRHTAICLYRDESRWFSHEDHQEAKVLYPHVSRCIRLLHQKWQLTEDRVSRFHLTAREEDIVLELLRGRSYAEIGDVLRLSHNTLKWHMKNIFQKADVTSLAGLLLKLYQ